MSDIINIIVIKYNITPIIMYTKSTR